MKNSNSPQVAHAPRETSTRRVDAWRKDRAEEGHAEVRGVYAPKALHAEAKEHFREWLRVRQEAQ
jgi:hypothetical protein